MSRGLGRIGRVVLTAITEADAAGRNVVVLDDALYRRAFPGLNRIDQKHRVSMLRAARSVADRSDYRWELGTAHRPARLHHSGHTQIVWATWQTDAGVVQWRKLRPDSWEGYEVQVTLYGRQHSISANMLRSYSPGSGSSGAGNGYQVGAEYGRSSRATVHNPLFTLSREGFTGWDLPWRHPSPLRTSRWDDEDDSTATGLKLGVR